MNRSRQTISYSDISPVKYDPNNPERSFQKMSEALLNMSQQVKSMSRRISDLEYKLGRR